MKNQKNYDDKIKENNFNLEEIEKEEMKQFDIQLKNMHITIKCIKEFLL